MFKKNYYKKLARQQLTHQILIQISCEIHLLLIILYFRKEIIEISEHFHIFSCRALQIKKIIKAQSGHTINLSFGDVIRNFVTDTKSQS